jgi:hypothetical protein
LLLRDEVVPVSLCTFSCAASWTRLVLNIWSDIWRSEYRFGAMLITTHLKLDNVLKWGRERKNILVSCPFRK